MYLLVWIFTILQSSWIERFHRIFQVTLTQISFWLVTWFWIPLQLALMFWAGFVCAKRPMNWLQYFGFVSGIGIATGGSLFFFQWLVQDLGITITHELIHKSSSFEQNLGKIIFISVCYGHFNIGKESFFFLLKLSRTAPGSS